MLSFQGRCLELERRGFAGHNKWSKIKRKKGANDALRSAMITKTCREVAAAAKASGGDLDNLRLVTAVSKARQLNVPKDAISSAVDRGINGKDVSNAEVVRYDGTVKSGSATVCVVIMGLTDNKVRGCNSSSYPFLPHLLPPSPPSLSRTVQVQP